MPFANVYKVVHICLVYNVNLTLLVQCKLKNFLKIIAVNPPVV